MVQPDVTNIENGLPLAPIMGTAGFQQTVTGKAIFKTFTKIGKDLNNFFGGNITQRKFDSMETADLSSLLSTKGGNLYLGTRRMKRRDLQELFSEQPSLYFEDKK